MMGGGVTEVRHSIIWEGRRKEKKCNVSLLAAHLLRNQDRSRSCTLGMVPYWRNWNTLWKEEGVDFGLLKTRVFLAWEPYCTSSLMPGASSVFSA